MRWRGALQRARLQIRWNRRKVAGLFDASRGRWTWFCKNTKAPDRCRRFPGVVRAQLVHRHEQLFFYLFLDAFFRESADCHFWLTRNRDEEKRRNAPNTKRSRQFLFLVCVDLVELHFAALLFRELVYHRAYHA